MSQNIIKSLVERHVSLVDTAQDFFKKASLHELNLDTNILFEYKNCVRAQADVLRELVSNGGFQETPTLLENIATANLAAKCIINDCVDILHTGSKLAAAKLNGNYSYPISSFYSAYIDVCRVIAELDAIIPKTRGENRPQRVEVYIAEFTSERAETLHKFLSAIGEIENHMRHKQKEEEEKKKESANQDDRKEKQNWKRLAVQLIAGLFIAGTSATLGWSLSKTNGQVNQTSTPLIQGSQSVGKATPKKP
jgi:hypothetical protein